MEWVSVFPDCVFPQRKAEKVGKFCWDMSGTKRFPNFHFQKSGGSFVVVFVFCAFFGKGGGAEMSFIRSDFNLQQFRDVNANFIPVSENSEDLLENLWRF